MKTTITLCVTLFTISSLHAALTFVDTRAGLNANDSVDWGQLGPSGTSVASPSSVVSAGGLAMTVSSSGGMMERLDQGNGWNGNFATGDKLLWNLGNQGDISISFSSGIYGFGGGAQVQANYYGSFTGTISAYGAANNLLGSYTFPGVSDGNGDNSAPFAGILSDTADIYRISFSAVTVNPDVGGVDFAINDLSLVTEVTTPVPEPTTVVAGAMLLLPLGANALRILRSRRQM